jgi:hypothetical protein
VHDVVTDSARELLDLLLHNPPDNPSPPIPGPNPSPPSPGPNPFHMSPDPNLAPPVPNPSPPSPCPYPTPLFHGPNPAPPSSDRNPDPISFFRNYPMQSQSGNGTPYDPDPVILPEPLNPVCRHS